MDYSVKELDIKLLEIMNAMWVALIFSAPCVFGTVCVMYVCPSAALGAYRLVPSVVEHLLAACAVICAFGTVFQYLGGRR